MLLVCSWTCLQPDMSIVGHQTEATAADVQQFRPFTRQSLETIRSQIAEKEAKRLAAEEAGDPQVS